MINLFQAASNDQSLYYLGQIFGYVGNVLPISGSPSLILGVMFKTFNSIVLTVAVLVVVYVTVIGVMKTAQEGEVLGRQWSGLWVPIRMVIGIAALVPAPSGYSAIQIVIMWVIVQGIGAADTIWNTALNYISYAGSPYAGVQIPTAGVNNSIQNLFKGLVCMSSASQTYPNPEGKDATTGGYYCADPNHAGDSFCQRAASGNLYDLAANSNCSGDTCTFPMGPVITSSSGACGTMTYCNASPQSACANPTSVRCTACKAQTDALKGIVTTLGSIADLFVQRDYQYRSFYEASGNPTPPSWVQNYCSSSNPPIPPKQCCKASLVVLGGSPTPTTICLIGTSFTDNDVTNGNPDDTNAGKNAITGLYWQYGLSQSATVGSSDFIKINVNQYISGIVGAVITQIQQMAQNPSSNLPEQLQDARTNGWIFAGAYYYYIAQLNNSNLKDANPNFAVAAPNGTDPLSDSLNPVHIYRNNYIAADHLLTYLTQLGLAGTFGATAPPALSSLSGSAFSGESNILDSFIGTVSGSGPGAGLDTNALSKLQSLGEGLLLTVEILFSVLLITFFVLAILGNIDVFVLGTGADDPAGPALATISLLLVPLLLGFMGVFTAIGATLAVYTPLIPYIIFVFGVISWFILVIEAMVAAPLVALGILSPEAQHDILGKGEPALMLVFSIFLRPGLMIFGMMASMLLAAVAVTMVNASFSVVMSSITAYQLGASGAGQAGQKGGGGVDILELIFFMVAYVSLIVAVLNKCFALIHMVPDRVLRWIHGGHAEETGGAPLDQVGGAVQQAGGQAAAAAGAGPSTAGGAVTGGAKAVQAGRAERDAAAAKAETKGDEGGGAAKGGGSQGGATQGGAGKGGATQGQGQTSSQGGTGQGQGQGQGGDQ